MPRNTHKKIGSTFVASDFWDRVTRVCFPPPSKISKEVLFNEKPWLITFFNLKNLDVVFILKKTKFDPKTIEPNVYEIIEQGWKTFSSLVPRGLTTYHCQSLFAHASPVYTVDHKKSFSFFRTNKYLKGAASTRVCAIAGFFVSIPLFLTGK